jgi:hypothetical protein
MADESQFEQNGAKLLVSMGMFAVAGPGTLLGAVGLISSIVGFMTSGDSAKALNQAQKDIVTIKSALTELESRLDELVDQVAIQSNRQTLARLNDHLDQFRVIRSRLHNHPGDVDVAVDAANDAGVHLDEFLRQDFEIWRWVDIVEQHGAHRLAPDRFKNLPTLPVYVMGMAVWLAARQRVFDAHQLHRLDHDDVRVTRHLAAVSLRTGFDKYRDGALGNPTTIAENIVWHVRAWVITSHEQPEDRTCDYFFQVRNWMTNKRTTADPFSIVVESDEVLCTIDPESIGEPNIELDWESDAGADLVAGLATTLQRVANTGSMAQQLIGTFPSGPAYPPSYVFIVRQDANLDWYRNDESTRPGGSNKWQGPVQIGTGFGGFSTFFNGGGAAMYGVQLDGTLRWYGYDGYVSGTLNWREPKVVGSGWDEFTQVFPGGEYIIYGILPTGELRWYKHLGGPVGGGAGSDWLGPHEVGVGWNGYQVFSGGDGVIYGINEDGDLHRVVHLGYLDGTVNWGGEFERIATGWNTFAHVAATWDGVIYGFKRDGRVYYTRYGPPRDDPDSEALEWEGPPIEIKRVPGFRYAFCGMATPFIGPA